MCNSYRITPKGRAEQGIPAAVAAAAARLPAALVRKSDMGLVVIKDGEVKGMRWGFARSFNSSINNTRADKVGEGMWAEAFRDRRCVIPASAFYEWGPGAAGKKQAFEFRAPGDDYLWIAGVWEPNADFGPCYSMITTDAPPIMAPIHDCMPAVLAPAEVGAYLNSAAWTPRPYLGELHVEPCASPLKPKPSGPQQQELF